MLVFLWVDRLGWIWNFLFWIDKIFNQSNPTQPMLLWFRKYIFLIFVSLINGEQSLSPFGLLVEDIKVSSASFCTLLYSHTKREGNKVAHGLTRHTIHVLDYVVWIESIPPVSYAVFLANLANIFQ